MAVACALIPRFALLATLANCSRSAQHESPCSSLALTGGRRRALLTKPLALAPEPGGPQAVGETSGPAEAFGVRAGMRLGEALARCPELALVPPDPERAEAAWEEALRRLEAIGAAVEPGRPGEAFFEATGLRGLWGGSLEGVLRRARKAIGPSVRLGAGQTRLCAYAAALGARPRRGPVIVPGARTRAFLAPLPVDLLRERLFSNRAAPGGGAEEAARIGSVDLPEKLERLGVSTLGQLAELPEAAIADRFGEAGLRALRMARGTDEPLRPRRAHEELVERLELAEATSGPQLERVLALLIDRLLAHPARRGRSLRRLRLGARLAGGGSWRSVAALRRASADPVRLRLALLPRLEELPGPAASLSLRALETGASASDQATLGGSGQRNRRRRLDEAVRQARAAAGKDAVLRVLDVDSESRVPERRSLLTPYTTSDDPPMGTRPAAPGETSLFPPIAGSTVTSTDP
jgi:protein ImuB